MIVYHGSNQAVINPDIAHSYRALDFGKGFYVTSVKSQAERWAYRKASIEETGKPTISIYEMKDKATDFIIKEFDEDLAEWIDFVCRCRDDDDTYREFDIIKGKVADDKVFRVVDFYKTGIWDKERALKEIKTYPDYDQIAFINQKAIDDLLTFKYSYEAEIEDE